MTKMLTKDSLQIEQKKPNVVSHLALGAYTMLLTASSTISIAMASTLGTKIKTAMTTIYGDIKDIFDVCAIVALAFSLLLLLFGRSDKSAEPSYKAIKTIIACFVIFHCLGWLVPWILSTVGHQDYSISIPVLQNLITII